MQVWKRVSPEDTIRHGMDATAGGCPDENSLSAFLAGNLAGDARRDLERHLVTCRDCLDLLGAAAPLLSRPLHGTSTAVASDTSGEPSVRTVFDARPGTLSQLSAGTMIGRYILMELLGQGGMGVVYAAYDPELERKVAIKLLRISPLPGQRSGDEARSRLVREAKAIARLSHLNVVVVHDAGSVGDLVFVATELISGVTVRLSVNEGPKP
jgi:hypothetical protein